MEIVRDLRIDHETWIDIVEEKHETNQYPERNHWVLG